MGIYFNTGTEKFPKLCHHARILQCHEGLYLYMRVFDG